MGGPGKPETGPILDIRYFNPYQAGFQAENYVSCIIQKQS